MKKLLISLIIIAIACMAWRYMITAWIGGAIIYTPIYVVMRIIQILRG